MFTFPQVFSKSIFSVLSVCLLAVGASAQPSGGPYGPIEQNYSLPDAKTIYYVAPDGKADAAGTELKAPTTIEAAISRVKTGDAIVMRGGVYRTGNLVLNQGITIQPYADEKPIMKGTEVATDWKVAGTNVWSTSWEELFPSKPMFWWRREREEARTPMHRFNNDMVFIDGRFLQSAGSVEDLTGSTYYIDYDKKQVYIALDPSEHVVEITTHDTALLRTSSEVHGKTADKKGPQIRGITFTQYAWAALAIEGKRHFTHLDEPVDEPIGIADPSTYGKEVVGTLIENVTISFCSRVAGYFRGDGLVIRNSLISDTTTEGIYVIGSSDVLLERNIVQRNNIERITGYYVSAVKIINQTHNVVVKDNIVRDHPASHGVWYDVGNYDGVFINNYVEGTDAGFMQEISQGVTVAGNVFVDNDWGVWLLNSSDAKVYNNTFVNSPVYIKRDQRSAQGDHFDWHPATGPGVEERDGHIFLKNLLVSSRVGDFPLMNVAQSPEVCKKLKTPSLAEMDGNVYVRPATPYPALNSPSILWVSTDEPTCTKEFDSLAAFKKENGGYEKNGVQLDGDPLTVFNASYMHNYTLRAPLPAAESVVMPKEVRKALGWSNKTAEQTVGAYPFAE